MSYNTNEVLKDAKRNPIPQLYDPVSDSFKPLTIREFYGKSTDIKPTANIEKGSVFFEMDKTETYMFDGTVWMVI